jgi:hypothetical protein
VEAIHPVAEVPLPADAQTPAPQTLQDQERPIGLIDQIPDLPEVIKAAVEVEITADKGAVRKTGGEIAFPPQELWQRAPSRVGKASYPRLFSRDSVFGP